MFIPPMKATLAGDPFDSSDWFFEVKWDGYRMIAEKDGEDITLFSRNKKVYNERFPQIVKELIKIKGDFVLDGEAVVLDKAGKPNFAQMQEIVNSQKAIYVVFDILKKDGKDLTSLPLADRKEILAKLVPKLNFVEVADFIECDGIHFFEVIKKEGLEGVVAKKKSSTYQPGKRSKDWLKIKNIKEEEALILGYTQSEKGEPFGALLLGQYINGRLTYIGKVGTGFSQAEANKLKTKMDSLKNGKYEVTNVPEELIKNLIKPNLVAQIKFTEKTKDGSYRHPSFLGLRDDKNPKEVVSEKKISSPVSDRRTSAQLIIDGQKITISNPEKVFWEEAKVTKKDLVEYYIKVTKYILPFLIDRPESLHRFPNGVKEKGFFQKNYNLPTPNYISKKEIYSKSNNRETNFLICNNAASLIYLANLGCIEINPWSSKLEKLQNPTWLVIDLDPEGIGFEAVIKTAQASKMVFDRYKIKSFPKTSGATGIHIYIPMAEEYSYETVKNFAHFLATEIHKLEPEITSLERLPEKRQGKVYVDFLQNNYGATVAAPFSARPQNTPNVSMPLEWDEIKPGLVPEKFTIQNSIGRIPKAFKLFEPVLKNKTNIKNIMDNI